MPTGFPSFAFEDGLRKGGNKIICGVDEAGRGPWAGPVVAAAVILDADALPDGLNDSKKLTPARREVLFAQLQHQARIGVGAAGVEEIDRLNIVQATLLAMARAVTALPVRPHVALIDGNAAPKLDCACRTLVKGDGVSLSIAAASIVAKVTRDRIMDALARAFPVYAWEKNKGYGTPEHQSALEKHGVTQHHRRSFKPVHNILCRAEEPQKSPLTL